MAHEQLAPNFPARPAYDNVDDMLKVKSVQKKFRDSFPGPDLDPNKWEAFLGAGGGMSFSAGTLQLTAGTFPNAETFILSKEIFTVPFRASFNLGLSARIANSSFLFEAVSVDPVTGIPDGLHSMAFVFDGTTATSAKYRVQNSGLPHLLSGAVSLGTTAGGVSVYEMEPFADEAWFHSGVMDSNAGRAVSYRRHQQIPDPNAVYRIKVGFVNGAVAPASSVTATMQFVAVQDYAELTAEITAGRGQTVAGQGIGVNVISMPTVAANATIINTPVFYADSIANLAAAGVFTGVTRDSGTAAIYQTFVASSHANVAGTLEIQKSTNGTAWSPAARVAVGADQPVELSVRVTARYYRVVYTNGAGAQTSFNLTSAYHRI